MSRERYTGFQSVKLISEVVPGEYDSYLQIPGWKVWELDYFTRFSHEKIAAIASAKNNSLYIFNDDNRAQVILDKQPEEDLPLLFATGSFVTYSSPDYLLEPLSEEELKNIIEQRTIENWKTDYITHDLLTPEELEKMLENKF